MAAILGILLLPFLGTALGAGTVYVFRKSNGEFLQQSLSGIAAGVMIAASIWSLILPALEGTSYLGKLACLPVLAGIWCGVWLLELSHRLMPGFYSHNPSARMLFLAVTLHNLPEGMAVGVAIAGFLAGHIPLSGAVSLSLGIALQNLPEGAIISLPLACTGGSKHRAFARGVLSGIVEPIGGAAVLLLASFLIPILPFLLSFAAGAMVYVVVQELIPDMQKGLDFESGATFFTIGFTLMMLLDVLLS